MNGFGMRLKKMYDIKTPQIKPITPTPTTAPRVGTMNKQYGEKYTGMNQYRPKKRQRFPLGTRVQIIEKTNSKRTVFIGKAEEHNPSTGLYHVVFEDGEYEEFDDDEMKHFKIVKLHAPPQPSSAANQIIIPGFYPKATTRALQQSHRTIYGLNAGSIWDDELHKWMAYKDLIHHPNPTIKQR